MGVVTEIGTFPSSEGSAVVRAGTRCFGANLPFHENQRAIVPFLRAHAPAYGSSTVLQNSVISRLLDHTAWGIVCGGFYVAFCSTDMMIEAQMLDQG